MEFISPEFKGKSPFNRETPLSYKNTIDTVSVDVDEVRQETEEVHKTEDDRQPFTDDYNRHHQTRNITSGDCDPYSVN